MRKLLDNAEFSDGRLSAGKEAESVKNNKELAAESPLHQQLNSVLMPNLLQHAEFQSATLPLKVATPFYARYEPAMEYGYHVDDPVMGPPGQQYRADVSVTVFLSQKDEYQGGELMIETPFGEQSVKLDAGDAVVYPSSSLHRVAPVTQGQRLVAVLWLQSMVRDMQQRALLHELSAVRDRLKTKGHGLESESRHLANIYANLVRLWSEI